MPINSIVQLFSKARAGGYAVGYFESWNLESLQGVIDAAELTRSPVIIGFNGEFLTRQSRLTEERLSWYAALARSAAESATVPCSIFFNECPDLTQTYQAVDENFNMVMYTGTDLPLEEFTSRVCQLTRHAHQKGIAVEAEIDELPSGTFGVLTSTHSSPTDPELAAHFCENTGIDLLSISVGNVHAQADEQIGLDLVRLEGIQKRVNTFLGLHGGSGIPADSLREAVQLGIVKVAYGTYMKQKYLNTLRKALASSETNPHKLLGMGGEEDIMVACRLSTRDAVMERIEILGCCGKA
jgi:fructose/tagatose bisphosphate aldolase